MAHLLNSSQSLIDALNRVNIAPIDAKVLLYVKGYKITSVEGNKFTYDTSETENHCFDVSNAVSNESIVIRKTIPELPTFGESPNETQYGSLKIQLQKMYGDFWQFVGQGAGITQISSILFEIYAKIQNVPLYPMYKGKVNLAPSETFDTVTFEVESSLWDMIDKELLTNQYNTTAYVTYGTGIISETKNAYIGIATPFQSVIYHNPILYFNEQGNIRALVSEKDNEVSVLKVYTSFTVGAKLGKYTLKWINEYSVYLSTPTFKDITIVHTTITASGLVVLNIPLAYQSEIGIERIDIYVTNPQSPLAFTEIRNKEIEFWLSFTCEGNPISIALDMIIRAYTDDWNNPLPVSHDSSYPINYAAFYEFEEVFSYVHLYIDEYNKENKVFEFGNDKPIQTKNIVQKILDHVGVQLTFDVDGKISLNANWFYNENQSLQRIGSIHAGTTGIKAVPSHAINGTMFYNGMELKYATNQFNGNSADSRNFYDSTYFLPNARKSIYKPTLPYYKLGVSDLIIDQISLYLWKWVQTSYIRLTVTLLPQFGQTLDVGDKFIADFDLSPILPNIDKNIAKYFMIYGINKKIGKEVTIDCICCPEPILPSRWCEAYWCNNNSKFK